MFILTSSTDVRFNYNDMPMAQCLSPGTSIPILMHYCVLTFLKPLSFLLVENNWTPLKLFVFIQNNFAIYDDPLRPKQL